MSGDGHSVEEDRVHTLLASEGAKQPESVNERQPSRSDIAQAVASRLQNQGEAPVSKEEAKRKANHRWTLLKLVNEVTGSVKYEKSSACLELIYTLTDNILRHPNEVKYRSFKASQPKISRDVLSMKTGKAVLVEIGFRTRTNDFQQEWFIPTEWMSDSFGLKKLQWSREILDSKRQEVESNASRVRLNKELDKAFESNRKARVLDEAREDRERVALRAERERIARKAAQEKAAAATVILSQGGKASEEA